MEEEEEEEGRAGYASLLSSPLTVLMPPKCKGAPPKCSDSVTKEVQGSCKEMNIQACTQGGKGGGGGGGACKTNDIYDMSTIPWL